MCFIRLPGTCLFSSVSRSSQFLLAQRMSQVARTGGSWFLCSHFGTNRSCFPKSSRDAGGVGGRHWCVGRPALCHRWLSARPTPGRGPGVPAPLSPAGLSPLSRPRRRLLPAKVFKMKPLHHSLEMCYARGKEEQGCTGSFGPPPDRRSPT